MLRKTLGVLLLLLLPLGAVGQDKSKKTYELIYDDVQFLKKQVQELITGVNRNAEDLLTLNGQVKGLADLVRQIMSDQARFQEDVRGIPAQYRDLLAKIDQISLGLQKISADLGALKATESPPEAGEKTAAEEPAAKAAAKGTPEKPPAEKPVEKTPTTPPTPPPSNISPQEAYAMAYNDYLQGNFDLAIESFRLYKQQFPTSPLADNALYWVGECYFSKREFQPAIDSFDELILTYPNGDKVAAAYLKKGMSFQELKKNEEALAVYRLLVTKFPLEEEAKIAQAKIKELTDK